VKRVRALKSLVRATVGPVHSPPSVNAIRTFRGLLHLNRRSFGKQLGVTEHAVHQWEIGRRAPDIDSSLRMEKLAELNDLSLALLDDVEYARSKQEVHVFVDKEKSA